MHAYASRLVVDEDRLASILAPAGTSPLLRLLRSAAALLLAIVAPLGQAGIGDVDSGYGVNGRFEARSYGQVFLFPPLADGRLLYGAYADGGYRRTDVDGLPDESFGSGGVRAWPSPYEPATTGAWARSRDGRLLVILSYTFYFGDVFALMRLDLDGEPDPGFGINGLAEVGGPFDDDEWTASSLIVQPDGKLLLLLGHPYAEFRLFTSVVLVRLLADGRLDATFGDAGRVAVSTGPVDWMDGVSLTLLADGRIGVHAKSVTWLTPSGAIDPDPPDGQEWEIAALLPGGGAIARTETYSGHRLAKILVDGSLDTSFGPNGDGTVALPPEADYLSGVGVSPDGRFIFVTWGRNTDGHWRVSRVIGDGPGAGALDTSFGDQGTVDLKSTNAGRTVYGLLEGGAIITTADSASRLLGRDAPSPGFSGVDLHASLGSSESDGAAFVRVFRAAGSDGAIRLRYWTPPDSELPEGQVPWATPGVDFDAVDGVIDWSAGDDADKLIRIPLRADQVQEGTEQIYVRFEALSSGTWTVPAAAAVAVLDSPPPPTPTGGQSPGAGKSSGGGSCGWPGLLLMLAALLELRRQRRRTVQDAITQRS